MTNKTQQYGIGIESEGYILDSEGNVISKIETLPTIQYIQKQISLCFPQITGNVSPELVSFIVEVKSDVFSDGNDAISQVMQIRAMINKLVEPHGGRLIFQPVLDKPFEFTPSTDDPAHRAYQLAERWANHPESSANLRASSICSFQINDSRPFKNIDRNPLEDHSQQLEIARKIHNLMNASFYELKEANLPHVDCYGKSRLEYYFELVTRVKGKYMLESGTVKNEHEIVVPPHFETVEKMKQWMCAHSETKDFSQADSKNEHAITVKIKRSPYFAAETRIFDAVDNENEMRRLIAINEKTLSKLNP
jgi:hypothetical protein